MVVALRLDLAWAARLVVAPVAAAAAALVAVVAVAVAAAVVVVDGGEACFEMNCFAACDLLTGDMVACYCGHAGDRDAHGCPCVVGFRVFVGFHLQFELVSRVKKKRKEDEINQLAILNVFDCQAELTLCFCMD